MLKTWHKWALVVAGVVASGTAATWACSVFEKQAVKNGVDVTGGMYGFGQSLQWLGVFGIGMLCTIALGLWFIRGNERAWHTLSRVALAGSLLAPASGVFFLCVQAMHLQGYHPELGAYALVGFYTILGTPAFAGLFAALAVVAAGRMARRLMWIAAGVEGAVAATTATMWALRLL